MNPSETDRYEDQPLLRLLECYTLKAIGCLSEADEESLKELEPNLSQIYQQNGHWFEILEAVMQFPEGMPDQIADLWERNQEIAAKENVELAPQQFAEMFVDQNFSN